MKAFGMVDVVVSAWLAPGMIVMEADLTDDEKRAVSSAARKYETEGMSRLQAKARALAETGKVAVLRVAKDVVPKVTG